MADLMPGRLNVDWTGDPQPVPINNRKADEGWTPVLFNRCVAGAGSHYHGPGPLLISSGTSGAAVVGTLDLWLVDFTTDTEVQIRQFEVDHAGKRAETGLPHEVHTQKQHDTKPANDPGHDPAVTHHRYPVTAWVNPGHRLGFEVTQFHDSANFLTGVVRKAAATLLIWPK